MTAHTELTSAEAEALSGSFGLLAGLPPDSPERWPCLDLLDEARCAAYLDRLAATLPSPSRRIAASQFAKRYAFVAAAPVLYAMTAYGKGVSLEIGSCSLDASPGRIGRIRLLAPEARVTEPEAGTREAWRKTLVETLFAGHIAPIWRTVSKVAKIPLPILWENAAVRVYSLYEKRMAATADARTQLRRTEDYDYLVRRAPGSSFGERVNPLGRFFGEEGRPFPAGEAGGVRIRRTCCLYYRASPDAEYCTTCPKLGSPGVPSPR
ncbi:IucA/IucC family C-terminal-domain containing protein [Cohnella hongkongensis]|uniref:IucA/IucC family C-terminal-domain containing protein n=1 Tax=Cohnella hongkongensis TaxID=178337 RepID=A0ABV9FHA7_9BACL